MRNRYTALIQQFDQLLFGLQAMLPVRIQRVAQPEFVKYVIIGVITQLIDLSTYALLVNLGVWYVLADLINNPLVLGFNYVGHKYFTFRSDKWRNVELGKYLLNLVFNFFYSTAVLVIAVDGLGLSPVWGKVLQILAIPLINFVALKFFVFRKPSA